MLSAIEIVSEESTERQVEESSDDEDACHAGNDTCPVSIRLKHKIRHVDVRRTIIDVGRCFCSGSIAGGALRDESTILHAVNLKRALQTFSICSHNVKFGGNDELVDIPVCTSCCTGICEAGNTAIDEITTISGLCFALADCMSYGELRGLRELRAAVADVISAALETRATYFDFSKMLPKVTSLYTKICTEVVQGSKPI